MRKECELSNPESCLNKADDLEMIFVLRGKDLAAPSVIRMWAEARITLGLNTRDDAKMREALQCAGIMELERESLLHRLREKQGVKS